MVLPLRLQEIREIFKQMDEATDFWVFRFGAAEVFSTKPKTICCCKPPTTLQPAVKNIWITEYGIRARETKCESFFNPLAPELLVFFLILAHLYIKCE